MKRIFIAFLALVVCSSCSDKKSNYLVPYVPPDKDEKVTDVGTISKESFRPSLDILFVIDNSSSMDAHQQDLATNIPLFTNAISKAKFLDYHIGVITSSSQFSLGGSAKCCGQLAGYPTYVDRSTPYGMDMLASNILVGTDGDSTERFFEPSMLALTEPNLSGYNKGFYRPNSYLVLLFITDTDDQSSISENQFYDFLVKLKGSADHFFIGAAYIPKSEYSTCDGEFPTTTKLDNFFKMTHASFFSLCAPDFGQKLAAIGSAIALKSQTMYLDRVPKQGTIKITIGTMTLPEDAKTGWSYNPVSNAIEFGPDIPWDTFPDNTFPQIDYQAIVFKDKSTKK